MHAGLGRGARKPAGVTPVRRRAPTLPVGREIARERSSHAPHQRARGLPSLPVLSATPDECEGNGAEAHREERQPRRRPRGLERAVAARLPARVPVERPEVVHRRWVVALLRRRLRTHVAGAVDCRDDDVVRRTVCKSGDRERRTTTNWSVTGTIRSGPDCPRSAASSSLRFAGQSCNNRRRWVSGQYAVTEIEVDLPSAGHASEIVQVARRGDDGAAAFSAGVAPRSGAVGRNGTSRLLVGDSDPGGTTSAHQWLSPSAPSRTRRATLPRPPQRRREQDAVTGLYLEDETRERIVVCESCSRVGGLGLGLRRLRQRK
jgi:hypothetical protein